MDKTKQEILDALRFRDKAALNSMAEELRKIPEIKGCLAAMQETARRNGHTISVRLIEK